MPPTVLDERATAELTIGEAVRFLRERVGMSRRALSLAAGLSDSYVGKVESGAIDPSFRAFAKLAQALGMRPREVHLLIVREAARS